LFIAQQSSFSAQVTGAITGTVRDETGAVLPGVSITASSEEGIISDRSVISDGQGSYWIAPLPPGSYTVIARLSGFADQEYRNLRLAINQELRLDIQLRVRDIAETIQVQAAPSLLQARRSDLSSRVDGQFIKSLPLNGRNFVDLVALVPGAKPRTEEENASRISLFGERAAATSFVVDGADNNHPVMGGPLQHYTQESIQEFEVITTGYQAEFGRAQGGVVNIITRSGSNRFSGSGFLFARDDGLDSSNVKSQPTPELSRQQWGGSIGGPLGKGRAFFFGAVEVLDEKRGLNIDQSRIPHFVQEGIATPEGEEDLNRGPQTDGLTGMFRLDAELGNEHRLFGMVNWNDLAVAGEVSSPVAGTLALPSAARLEETSSSGWTVRDVWVWNPSSILETTFHFADLDHHLNRDRIGRPEPVLLLLNDGFLQTGAPFGGRRDRLTDRIQVSQTVGLMAGASGQHHIKFGWDWTRSTVGGFDQVTNDLEYSAAFLDPNQADVMREHFRRFGFQQPAARFFSLSGNPDGSLELDVSNHDWAFFLQDSWRLRDHFTLNLGLRYDYASLFGSDADNLAPRMGFAWDPAGNHKTVLRGSMGIFHDRNLLSAAATVPELGGVFTRSLFDVALPRLGYTYTDSLIDLVITSGFPTAEGGRTPPENPRYSDFANALRNDPLALYKILGIAVEDPTLPPVVSADNIKDLSGLSPREALERIESTFPGTDWEFFDIPGGSLVGNRVLSFFPRGPLGLTREISRYSDARTPWTTAFNIGLQHEFAGNFLLSLDYVHRRSRDLLTRRIVNLYDVDPGDPRFGQTTDGGPRINQVTYEGRVHYDGLIASVKKRLAGQWSLAVTYTGSRVKDNLLTGEVGSTFTDNNNPELDWGPSNLSAPHVFVAHSLVQLPFGVTLSKIAFWRSGSAFNPRGITDQDGDGLVDQRDPGVPRNSFRTSPYFDLDFRLEKSIALGDRQFLSFYLEAFNLTNRANVRNVQAVAGPSFGVPNAFLPGRELQLGVRFHMDP